MTLKAVLFDFNGTIINDEAIHATLIQDLLLAENLRPDGTDYQHCCLGRSDRACLRDLLRQRGRIVSDQYLNQLLERKRQAYLAKISALDKLPIYPGVTEFIHKLQGASLLLGVVTGAGREEVEMVLGRSQLAPAFSVIVTGDDIPTSKPDPLGYLLAVERLQRQFSDRPIEPHHCLAIEDSLVGIEAAKNAGMQVVGVAQTYPFHMLQRQANWTVDRFTELELERVEAVFARRDLESPV